MEKVTYYNDNGTDFEFETKRVTKAEQNHCHSRIEIMRVKEDRIRMCMEMVSATYDAYKDDIVVIKSSDIHYVFPGSDATIESVRFPNSFTAIINDKYVSSSFIVPHEAFDGNEITKSLIDKLFEALKHEYDNKESKSLNSGTVRSLCCALYALILDLHDKRRIISSRDPKNTILPQARFETVERFGTVLEYINQHYCDYGLNLDVLSKESGINKTSLSSLFPKLTGVYFTDYLHNIRINRAIELMCSDEKSISEIAFSCGFETIRSFNNVFKALMGVPPSAFLACFLGKSAKGINNVIDGTDQNIFNYNWESNVDFAHIKESSAVHVICTNTVSKLWCHLMLRMVFSPGQRYKASYKAKTLSNSQGIPSPSKHIGCTFQFPDSQTNSPYHHPQKYELTELFDEWVEYTAYYTIPNYYIPSTKDYFSVYSNPIQDLGVSYLVKDVRVERITE